MPEQTCPTCGTPVRRVTIPIGAESFVEPCCCPVTVTMTGPDGARLEPAAAPAPAANPRLPLGRPTT